MSLRSLFLSQLLSITLTSLFLTFLVKFSLGQVVELLGLYCTVYPLAAALLAVQPMVAVVLPMVLAAMLEGALQVGVDGVVKLVLVV